jgi:crotonobetainyl-CoA:carnitine CoA-transferase CaiB-like acyl-CoA transferase
MGALTGLKVIDLSRILAGPSCTQILGDLGADIIKIEKPDAGDDTRQWGPPFLKDDQGNDTTESAYYLSANRNKFSVGIDISTKEGQAILHDMLIDADVLIENFKVGNLAKYGLSYEQLSAQYPHLIYCSITGFGQTGPMAKEPGYDYLAQALSGLMASTGEQDGHPMKAGVAVTDIITGLYAAIGILAALHHREHTGKGQNIDVALLDCSIASLTNIAQYYLTSDTCAPRLGNAHSTIVPYQVFATKDSFIVVAVGNDDQFTRFADLCGHSEWAKSADFAKNKSRVKNRATLVPLIAKVMLEKSTADWVAICQAHKVPVAPVNNMAQAFAMPQTQAREMRIEMPHLFKNDAAISLVGSPLKMSESKVEYRLAPPSQGQHTETILLEMGLTPTQIEQLRIQGIIQ